MDGEPRRRRIHLASDDVTYVYQGGIEPAFLHESPGALVTAIVLQRAIEQGGRAVDFLRGDEPYKQHFRASRMPLPGPSRRSRSPSGAIAGRPLVGGQESQTMHDL